MTDFIRWQWKDHKLDQYQTFGNTTFVKQWKECNSTWCVIKIRHFVLTFYRAVSFLFPKSIKKMYSNRQRKKLRKSSDLYRTGENIPDAHFNINAAVVKCLQQPQSVGEIVYCRGNVTGLIYMSKKKREQKSTSIKINWSFCNKIELC